MSEQIILLADDSSTVRTMLSRILTQAGFRVVAARDGKEALELVQKELPSLAILDIVMPELDGYGVVEKLKEMGEPYNQLPLLFLTCLESNALEMLGNEYGAYLKKPVDNQTLLDAIQQNIATNV